MGFGRSRLRRAVVLSVLVTALSVVGGVAPTPAEAVVPVRMETLAVPLPRAAGADVAPALHTDPFAMVALAMPEATEAEIRTALGDSPWSAWTPMPHQHDEGPDAGSDEARAAAQVDDGDTTRTHPLFTDVADRIQVRATSGDLAGVEVVLIDPFGLDRSPAQRAMDALRASWHGTPRSTAGATADMPDVVTRAEWGADESIVGGSPSYARRVERAFIHHTVGSNSYSQAQAAGVVRGVQAYHVNGNGWSDIGYNFLVDRFGTIYEGRAGGMDRPVIGAQAGGFNTGSTGIALMGTYTSATPDAVMVGAVQRIVAWKADVHHFDPLGTSVALSGGSSRYPSGQLVTLSNISGHRDVSTTTCPGDGPYALLQSIRDGVRAELGDAIFDHRADIESLRAIRGDPDPEAITFSAVVDPPGSWSIEVYGPDRQVVHRASGDGADARTTMALAGDGWALGEYDWVVFAPGRRLASDVIRIVPPQIRDTQVSTTLATADADGRLVPPVAFVASLWNEASWILTVTDPTGREVHRQEGRGERLDAGWLDGVVDPGTYTWTVSAEDAAPVSRPLDVRYDLFDRVGDTDDPIFASALLSSAAFPAGTATRAVVARHDLFADALSGGPLAGSDGPLLLTPSDGLDGRIANELRRVLAPGATIYVLGGTAAISPAVADQLGEYGRVVRLSGASRIGTAAAVAEVVWNRSGTTTAMIARAGPDDAAPWADALSGGAFGAVSGIPVLLSDSARLSSETAEVLQRRRIASTIVLGGTAAISQAVVDALPAPRRLSGDDRTATAAAVAQELWTARGPLDGVLLANGYAARAWVWALAAAPLAARQGLPLLLTTPDPLAAPTAESLRQLGVGGGSIVGPTSLVPPDLGYTASDVLRRSTR